MTFARRMRIWIHEKGTPLGAAAWGKFTLCLLGLYDVVQPRHSLLRNFPVIGHVRWIAELVRPEIRQYLVEADEEAVLSPFAFIVAHLQHGYYFQIMLPGGMVGLIVGYATQKYGTPTQRAQANQH